MVLISKNNKSLVCLKKQFSDYKDFKVPYKNKYELNYNSLRLIVCNNRLLDVITFPTINNYDNIIEKNVDSFSIKYKNSEIILEFILENNKINSLVIKSKIDENNLDNFVSSFEYLLNKLYMRKISLKQISSKQL